MASETIDSRTVKPFLSSIAFTVGAANLVTGLVGFIVCLTMGREMVLSFSAGFTIGITGLYFSMRILSKGIKKGGDAAARYVMIMYCLRFFATIIALGLIVGIFQLSPLPMVIGYIGTIFTTIGTIVVISRGEFRYA